MCFLHLKTNNLRYIACKVLIYKSFPLNDLIILTRSAIMRTPVRLRIPPSSAQLPDTSTRVILPRKRRAPHHPKSPVSTSLSESQPAQIPPDTPNKRRILAQDEATRQYLIHKILHETSRKAKDFHKHAKPAVKRRPDPPCIRYVSRREVTFLSVPIAVNLCKALNPAVTSPVKPTGSCDCGSIGKYKEPKTGVRFCSVTCYKRLQVPQ